MPRAPFEGWNVFSEELQKTLRTRRLSQNLVQTRTPFLRYTTTVQFDGYEIPGVTVPNGPAPTPIDGGFRTSLAQILGDVAVQAAYKSDYDGCRFFTLGLHGWDNSKYSDADIYNSQTKSGLVVGVTYKDGKQILVRTLEGETIESPHAYPPPGITSVTVDRLTSGNVLKFTIETVCYTQQQLDMLDLLAFVPGMTCVLEWGNVLSTVTGTQKLKETLDFSYPEKIKDTLNATIAANKNLRTGGASSAARTEFINKWCAPNEYNYDFAIAKIANVKTEVQDNKYKTTVIAYGVADNIMYISAYATSTPTNSDASDGDNTAPTYNSSIREYFAPNGTFISQLTDFASKDNIEVVKFDEPDNAQKTAALGASSTGTVNDLGLEDTFYITFNAFFNFFLNNGDNGILRIVNNALGLEDPDKKLKYFLFPIDRNMYEADEVPIVGYNKYLRSTDPSVMLLYNKAAASDAMVNNKGTAAGVAQQLKTTIPVGSVNKNAISGKAILTIIGNDIQRSDDIANVESGLMFLSKGVWLNSKAIQQVFLSARTIMEGIDALLIKINAATEGYWNLKITYDEEHQGYRLIDSNAMMAPTAAQRIYTFNKKLTTAPTSPYNVTGPDVLDIKIASDYPKLIFSQLAISGVNNASGVPNKTDLNFQRPGLYGSRLKDFLVDETPTPTSPASGSGDTKVKPDSGDSINKFVNDALRKSGKALDTTFESTLLQQAFTDSFPVEVRRVLTSIFTNGNRPLTPADTAEFLSKINNSDLNPNQIAAIVLLLKQRIKGIVNSSKTAEIKDMKNFELKLQGKPISTGGGDPTMSAGGTVRSKGLLDHIAVNAVITKIEDSQKKLLTAIDAVQTPGAEAASTAAKKKREAVREFPVR